MINRDWRSAARRQAGIISRSQLRSHGKTDPQIDRLISSNVLTVVHHGVLRVNGAPATELTPIWVGVLATRGVLVGSTAVYLWQCTTVAGRRIELAVPPRRRAVAPDGTRVSRIPLERHDVTTRYGLPVTSRRRSCLDYLGSLDRVEATTFADRAVQQGWLDVSDIHRRLESPSRGNTMLRKVLATMERGAEAESERRLHRVLRSAGIQGWVPNHPVTVRGSVVARIDVAFVRERIAIEVDGFAYHSARDRYQGDRTRQNLLVTGGWTVLRFTWEDVIARPGQVVATIRSALARAA